jgi:hypothetical protein
MYNFRGVLGGLTVAAATTLAGISGAAAFTIDGNLSDWGVTVADNDGSSFTPAVSLNGTAYASDGSTQTTYFLENTNDTAGHSVTVGPNQGGQDYDVEFMAASVSGTTLNIAIVSGLRPDNGFNNYGPGDIRLVTGTGTTFGIEMGGGIGGGAGGAIDETALGSTYGMNSSGVTTSYANADAAQNAGSIWSDVPWLMDPINPQTPTQFQIVNGTSTKIADADYVFTRNTVTTQHSIIEMSFDMSFLLGVSGGSLEIYWGPTCGNDFAHLTLALTTTIPDNDVPAPAAGGLMLAGLLGLGALRRRRKA